ncbi:HAD domain-containing protein [Burkholderia sp. 22PA0099]|uniref:HAD domain-containing protein n=1 Tax=Burkholderia sp. 22PA0099 TaxID=3237372 RepID=UPI0039C124A7
MTGIPKHPQIEFDNLTPTLFVDYDHTLHRGQGYVDTSSGEISLDTGNEPFEFAPILEQLLAPYPRVEIVLTTSWLTSIPLERAAAYMPASLAARVVGSTHGYKVPFGYIQNGSARTYVIRSYVLERRLRDWLAIDDAVYGATNLTSDVLPIEPHLVLLDAQQGLGDAAAQQRVQDWLRGLDGSVA